MKKLFHLSLVVFVALALSSCGEDENIDLDNQMEIEQYILNQGLNAQVTASGLYFVIDQEGNGEHPSANSTVTVDYRGYYTDGQEFDSSYSRGEPLTISLNQVILGWREGIPLFSKGGAGKLLIPSRLGYGATPPAGIPANAVLIFDVELIDF